jgi:hypothetical protein
VFLPRALDTPSGMRANFLSLIVIRNRSMSRFEPLSIFHSMVVVVMWRHDLYRKLNTAAWSERC